MFSGDGKGQVYMMAAFVFVVLFSIGMSGLRPAVFSERETLGPFLENAASELPVAYNLERDTTDLHNFTHFVKSVALEKNIDFRALWLISRNRRDNLLVTAGNFLGSKGAVFVKIGSQNASFILEDGEMDSAAFENMGESFRIEIEYEGKKAVLEWKRDKDNLYADVAAERGGNVARRVIDG